MFRSMHSNSNSQREYPDGHRERAKMLSRSKASIVIIFWGKYIFCGNCKHVKFNLFELFYRPKAETQYKMYVPACIPRVRVGVKSIHRFGVSNRCTQKVHFPFLLFHLVITSGQNKSKSLCTCKNIG